LNQSHIEITSWRFSNMRQGTRENCKEKFNSNQIKTKTRTRKIKKKKILTNENQKKKDQKQKKYCIFLI